jgi:carbon storage regulator
MLILSRRISESLIVGDRAIVIKVLGINGNQVRLGIEADKNIQVDREEVFLRKRKEEQGELELST